MSFTGRSDMFDGAWVLGNYTLDPQSPVQGVVNGGGRIRYHAILGSAWAQSAMKHGVVVSELRARRRRTGQAVTFSPRFPKASLYGFMPALLFLALALGI